MRVDIFGAEKCKVTFGLKYILVCHSFGDVTNKLTEHAIFFCKEGDNFSMKV